MSQKYNIYIEANGELIEDDRYIITGISTHGNDLDDCLCNAQVHIETQQGNEGPVRYLGDLSNGLVAYYERRIAEEIACADDRASAWD